MKKWILAIVAVIGLASIGNAQKFSIGGGLNVSAGSGSGVQFEATAIVGYTDIVRILFVGMDARLEGNLALGNTGTGFSLGAALLGTFSLPMVTLYAGPQVQYVIAPATANPFNVGAIVGARYNLILGVSAFGEVSILFTDPLFWRVRVGAMLTL
jgi:hypothetical protein